jgi:hypothetical protein
MNLEKHINATRKLAEKQTDPQKKMILEEYEALLVRAGGLDTVVISSPVNVLKGGVD